MPTNRISRHLRFYWRGAVSGSLAIALVIAVAPAPALAAVTVTTGGPFSYTEQDPALVIGTGTSVSGGGFYDGRFVDFEITGAAAAETLALQSVSSADISDGVVSVVGTAVYLGDGTTATPIGSIDSVSDGRNGTKLRINFGSDFRNPGFETGVVAPWIAVEQMVELGVTSIAGFVAADTATYPGNAGGDGDAPVSASYSVSTTSSDPPGPTEGTYALRLTSSMTTANGCDVVHGPAVYSAPFDAAAGQNLTFDWRAFAGSDAYAVFGYLLNTASGAQTEVLDEFTTNTNGTTAWATVSVTVPDTGTYRFVLVSGTYDTTCGRAAGASLYIDNFQVVSSDLVNDAIVSSVAELLTYENTGDNPAPVRTVTVTAESVGNGSASGTITVNITAENDPPVGSPVTREWENTAADDTFADITGTMSFSDPDSTSLTYSILGGTPGTYNVGGTDYQHRLVGTYGTLYVDESTGAYRIVADDAAIEAVATPVVEDFTIAASDGTDSGTAILTLGILIPSAPRNVVGTPGNAEVAVSWDQPGDTTGVTGYVATASPGGQTCATVDVASTSCTVTGLTNGTAYTFTVTPTIGPDMGTVSLPSAPVTPTGPPGAPISVVGTPGDGRVLMSWEPPASNGGTVITAYTVSASPGGGSCATTGATSCTVLGLAVGTTYTFTVHATNANGDGPESAPVVMTIKNLSTTTLVGSDTVIIVGDPLTLTATVVGDSPTGTVEFFDGSTSLGSVSVTAGVAELTTSSLAAGVHGFTAVYSGDSGNASDTSDEVEVSVMPPPSGQTNKSNPAAGENLIVTGENFKPNSDVEIWFMGDQSVLVGTVRADAAGGFSMTVTLPAGVTGEHDLQLRGANASGEPSTVSLSINILAGLPVTGVNTTSIAIVGFLLLLTGAALLLLLRAHRGSRRAS